MQSESVQLLGEFIGTFVLILLGNGVVCGVVLRKTKASDAGWMVITLGWGLAVMIAVYVSGFMGPAHLNPAVTLAMAATGSFSWSMVIPFIIAQMLGAMLASLVLWLFYYPHWAETKDPDSILGTFSTAPAIRHNPSNFFGEFIGTALLIIALLAFGQNKLADGQTPTLVGGIVTAIGLSLGATTGYAINPARDWGPRIMHSILPIKNKGKSGWDYAWIPLLGPLLGGVCGGLLFDSIIKFVAHH
ncbi:MIP/aquaporin family protein [Lactococcus termiticola]|uniref:Glycerol uptake facilitator protein n=1 Tax=Lactococcus termiticola TaxID=2169526 RepID=A0A2R5HE27_9LACT|nr:MIP/aquaporin family protein [Lactococcus termiticola]GBG96282.1 glycerol uptake facilitator protein [Lactococcus termiticola]